MSFTNNNPKSYLEQSLLPLVGKESVSTVVEYIMSFDDSLSNGELLTYLDELCGHQAPFKTIIDNFVRIRSKKSDDSANKITQLKQTEEIARRELIPAASGNIRFVQSKKSSKSNKTNVAPSANLNRVMCGCMATRHTFYTSCMDCGRIHCDKEGPGYCFFCDRLLEPPINSSDVQSQGGDIKRVDAYQLKDKLLNFDKEHAKRTQVKDAQSDYYETSTWLSEEEKAAIDLKEKKRLEKTKNKSIKISFDIAGRKIVQDTTEDEDMMENDNAASSVSAHSAPLENMYLALKEGSKSAEIYRNLRASMVDMSISNGNNL